VCQPPRAAQLTAHSSSGTAPARTGPHSLAPIATRSARVRAVGHGRAGRLRARARNGDVQLAALLYKHLSSSSERQAGGRAVGGHECPDSAYPAALTPPSPVPAPPGAQAQMSPAIRRMSARTCTAPKKEPTLVRSSESAQL
jgi:hypothetical protein